MKPISIPEAVMLVLSAQAAPEPRGNGFGMRYSAGVTEAKDAKVESRRVGLCRDCVHAQRIQSARGSTFYRCKLSDTDPTFSKYPRLPVLRCAGYVRQVEVVH